MSQRRHPNIINIDQIEALSRTQGKYGLTAKRLGSATGAKGIGCSWYEIPPGCTAFPAHYHCATEEAVFVLDGAGEVRIGDERIAVRAGDYVTFPVGPDHAHQLFNTGDAPLRYLCMSTMHNVDVVGYPDSNKIAALAAPVGSQKFGEWCAKWFPADADVDYFTGEE